MTVNTIPSVSDPSGKNTASNSFLLYDLPETSTDPKIPDSYYSVVDGGRSSVQVLIVREDDEQKESSPLPGVLSDSRPPPDRPYRTRKVGFPTLFSPEQIWTPRSRERYLPPYYPSFSLPPFSREETISSTIFSYNLSTSPPPSLFNFLVFL